MIEPREDIIKWADGFTKNAMSNAHNETLSLEDRFWPLDDIVCALAPDGDPAMYSEWQKLFDALKAIDHTFITRRDKIRELKP